jgi:hypothetical protein
MIRKQPSKISPLPFGGEEKGEGETTRSTLTRTLSRRREREIYFGLRVMNSKPIIRNPD